MPFGYRGPASDGRVAAVVDPGNLRRCEGDHLSVRIVPHDHVEVVEVAAARSHDDDFAHRSHSFRHAGREARPHAFCRSVQSREHLLLAVARDVGTGATEGTTGSGFGLRLSRHFMKTNTGIPKSRSMKPLASHSSPEPQIAQTE